MSNEIDLIKSRLDIVDVVGKYVELKNTGKNFSGKCPFHGEKTPSFIVSPDLQRYKCFGCGENGDIFNFIQKIENLDFPEALEKLANQAGVTLEKKQVNSKYQRLEDINRKAANFFYKSLLNDPDSLRYVKQRGFTDESIKSFGIGYASGGIELLNYIQKDNKYSKQELLESGLFTEKEGKLRGKFYKRIMFPIRSSSGKVIAFTGRVLPGNDYGPKYMNSPETPIYHKKENFYGQYEARQEIRKQDLVIMCEGTTDVISAFQSGTKNIVAPLGTALTKEQLEKISKLTKNILFLFDSDQAGQTALERAFPLAQELEMNAYAANTAPYKDLDELIKDNPEKLKTLIEKKRELYIYLLTEKLKNLNLNKYENYQKITAWANDILRHVKNASKLAFYVEKSEEIGKIKIMRPGGEVQSKKPQISTFKKISNRITKEEKYLQLLLYKNPLEIPKDHDIKYFDEEGVRTILELIKSGIDTKEELLKKVQEDDNTRDLLESVIFTFAEIGSETKEVERLYKNIIKEWFIRKENEINVRISIAEESGENKESERLLQEFQNLTIERKKYE